MPSRPLILIVVLLIATVGTLLARFAGGPGATVVRHVSHVPERHLSATPGERRHFYSRTPPAPASSRAGRASSAPRRAPRATAAATKSTATPPIT